MKPEFAIFDMDGTLIDSVDCHARAWTDAFAAHGHDVPFDAVRRQIGKGGDKLLAAFLDEATARARGDAIRTTRDAVFRDRFLDTLRPFPAVRALFERLRADGVRIAIASSAKGEQLAHFKAIAGIADLVDESTSADDAERSKPDPDIFAAALARLGGPDPARVVAVGDTPYDAEAATRAGIRTVAVLSGGFPEADLRTAGAVAVFRDPTDLLHRLGESPFGGA